MSFTPIARRYAFPGSESATERVGVFKAKQVCGLIQLQYRVGEVIPRHLVPGFIQDALEAGTRFLQATLQRARAHVKRLGDHIH